MFTEESVVVVFSNIFLNTVFFPFFQGISSDGRLYGYQSCRIMYE